MITSNLINLFLDRMKDPDKDHHSVIDELTNALQSYNDKSAKEKEKVEDPELRKIIDLQNQKIEKLQEEIQYFKMNSKEMEDQLEVMQEEYHEIQEKLTLANEEIDSMKEETTNLESEISKQMKHDKVFTSEISSLESKINNLEIQLQAKNDQIDKLNTSNPLDEEFVNLGEMRFNYEVEISALKNKLEGFQKLKGDTSQDKIPSQAFEKTLKVKEEQIKDEKAINEKLKSENNDLLVEIHKIKQENATLIKKYESEISSLKSEMDKLHQIQPEESEIKTKEAEPPKKLKEFSKAKLQEIVDSSKLAQNIINILDGNPEIKLKFLAMQLGTSQKKCMEELNKLEEINYIMLEYSRPADKNPTIKKSK